MTKPKPKIAIVYYSKTGHSRHVAERLTLALDADIFALHTPRYKIPFFGYMRAGFDSLRGAPAQLKHPLPDIKGYDAVILCGPVWTAYPAVPLLSYMQQVQDVPKVTGLTLTCGEKNMPEKAFAMAEKECKQAFTAVTAINNDIENTPEAETRIKEFVRTIRNAVYAKPAEVTNE